ncbi:MAG: glycosyltransferase [Bacillota bacterium]
MGKNRQTGASGRKPINVLTITNMYPSRLHPTFGIFVANQVGMLRRLTQLRVQVAGITERGTGLWCTPWKYLGLLFRVLFRAATSPVDIIHAHYIFPTGLIALVGRAIKGAPLVVTAHGTDVHLGLRGSKILRWLYQLIFNRAQAVIAVSQDLANMLGGHFSFAPGKLRVINCGVDTKLFMPGGRQEARHQAGLTTDVPLVLFVGNLVESKGVHVLLEALAMVKQKYPEARCLIIGDGPQRLYLENMACTLELTQMVNFLGFQPYQSLPQWYAAADLLVAPSLREGFGLVALEAMATGVPVVASRVGGLPEFVREGENGLLANPGDSTDLAAKIVLCLGSLSRKLPLTAARQTALDNDMQVQTRKVYQLYLELSKGEVEGN